MDRRWWWLEIRTPGGSCSGGRGKGRRRFDSLLGSLKQYALAVEAQVALLKVEVDRTAGGGGLRSRHGRGTGRGTAKGKKEGKPRRCCGRQQTPARWVGAGKASTCPHAPFPYPPPAAWRP